MMTSGTNDHDKSALAAASEDIEAAEVNKDVAGFEEEIAALAQNFYSKVKYSDDEVEAVMDLSTEKQVEFKTLALAVEEILVRYFGITLLKKERVSIGIGTTVSFPIPSENELPPRIVSVLFRPEKRLLSVKGKAPEDGRDGFTDLTFDWEKRSGTISPDGSIDWKKINSIPNIHKGELLVKIFDKTEGIPGVTCQGKMLKQKSGKRNSIHWSKKNIFRDEEQEARDSVELYSNCNGAINYSLRVPNDPRTLDRIEVSETLVVRGDINYEVGNLNSVASLDIQGNVRGNFSLQSDGFIHVSGEVEGKAIEAADVMAELVTNGCKVTASGDFTVSSINNAIATASTIHVKKNASLTVFTARDIFVLEENANCLGIKIHTKTAKFSKNKFAGMNEISLGEELFCRARELTESVAFREKKVDIVSADLKNSATVILTLAVKLEVAVKAEPAGSRNRKMIDALKGALVKSFQVAADIPENLVTFCYELQNSLGEDKYNESILRRIDILITHINDYNSIQGNLKLARNDLSIKVEELQEIRRQIKEELLIEFHHLELGGGKSEIMVLCGASRFMITPENFSKEMVVKYVLAEDEDDFSAGILKLIKPGN